MACWWRSVSSPQPRTPGVTANDPSRANGGLGSRSSSPLLVGVPPASEVDVGRAGGSPSAGFVQVIQGRSTDATRMRALGADLDRRMADRRPDLLGVVVALHDEDPGAFTQVAYFTSEEAARRGEQEELTGDEAEAMGEMRSSAMM